MIYLLQDCYKDEDNIYHDILKIGYSKDSFDSFRKSMYNTHNFGYKFLGEKEGSQSLETFLHKKFSKYRLSSGEWFEYSEEIIKGFWEISEEDVSDFSNQEELNEFIRGYILDNLVPSVNKLISLYLEKILGELKEKDPEYDKNKNAYKKEILITFDLVSSKEREYFEKLDFNSQENIKILEDYNLIVGKSKKKDNYLLNDIVLFYKTKRKGEKELSEKDFKELQDQRKKETKDLLELFNSANNDQKSAYLQKLKSDIKVSQYSRDFVSISKNTNLPVYNYLIEISNERAWEVSQKDYQDQISVTKSLYEAGYISSDYESEEDKIVSDFLDNHFYRTGRFEEQMKMYCEFCDIYGGNQDIMSSLDHKIKDSKYKGFYTFYGTRGCSAKEFEEKKLMRGFKNDLKGDKLASLIYSNFKTGDRYTSKDIKQKLHEIYTLLGISKTSKATDLGNYFTLVKTKVTLPDKTVKDGFRLDLL